MNLLIVITAKYVVYVILLAAAVLWFTRPKTDRWPLAVNGVLAAAIGLLLTKLAGKLYYDPRPFVVHHLTPLISHAADNGFPSDHTVLSALVAFWAFQVSRLWGTVLLVLAIAVGASRVAAHVHSPQDIVGGFVIAGVAVLLARYLTPKVLNFMRKRSPEPDPKNDEK